MRCTELAGRKGEKTAHLVISAFLQGFRAVDTGECPGLFSLCSSDHWVLACQPKHYRYVLQPAGGSSDAILKYREDLVGEALEILQDKHNIKREEIYIQTKYAHFAPRFL